MPKNRETKSPIKNLPVRQAGQSLRNQLLNLAFDRLLTPLMIVIACFMGAAQAWIQYWRRSFSGCVILTMIFVGAVVYALWRILPALREGAQLKLGRQGEEAVGQFLDEKLRPHGYQILHDIPGDCFNLDHVVIGTSGIYTVETKTHSKPAKGTASVQYDGKQITVNGFTPDRDPVVQAKAQARWLVDLFEQSTGRKFKVQPVVLYPGWFVEASTQWPDVWVMNEKQVPATITRQKPFIGEADVHLLTYHLKLHVLAKTKEEQKKNA